MLPFIQDNFYPFFLPELFSVSMVHIPSSHSLALAKVLMHGSDDDSDLDRLLQIDEEMQSESILPKVASSSQELAKKRILEEKSNLPSEDCLTGGEPKRRKSIFVRNTIPSLKLSDPSTGTHRVISEKHMLLSRIPLEGDYVSVTFSQGKRFYLVVNEDSDVSNTFPCFESMDLVDEAKSLVSLCSLIYSAQVTAKDRKTIAKYSGYGTSNDAFLGALDHEICSS